MASKKIVFLSPYPFDTAPGPRFRYEQYFSLLRENEYKLSVFSFLNDSTYKILYKKGHLPQKSLGIVAGFFRRSIHIFKILSSEYVFVYREASPIGYPFFEWFIARVLKKKIIYDFDDAIWLGSTSSENKLIEKLKFSKKVGMICKWSYKVSVGNKYLQNYSLQYNKNSFINPTTIDQKNYHNRIKKQETDSIVIGWTGSHSTLIYLNMIIPVLKRLDEKYDFTFQVIADKEIHINLKSFLFKKWNKQTEISDLLDLNIGIMPLVNDEWSKGKCGFKALQYMSLGIPAVVSPVGVNLEIITEGIDGFCCGTEEEWYQKLSLLIEDVDRRKKMGLAGIEKVKSRYSTLSNASNFLSLFS